MDCNPFITRSFWESPTNCVLGEGLDDLPDFGITGGAVVFKTSGSTGTPKWVVHEKQAILVSARAVNAWLGVDKNSIWGLALPTDHVGGFAILARVFQAGCGLVEFPRKWDAQTFQRWISEEGVSHVSLVPTQVHDLVAASLQAPSNLKVVVCGGGRLSASLGQAARDLGWPVLASYGMTEAGSMIATQSMGALNQRFDAADLEILPIWCVQADTEDRLILSGEALFRGYLFEKQTGLIFEPISAKTFFTQDRGKVLGHGLQLTGRMDAWVKVLGVLVDLEAVEKRFLQIAGARVSPEKFAVIPIPDRRKEHVLVAVFEGDIPSACIEEYQQAVEGLERFGKCLSVEKFPRSSLGKPMRGELLKMCTD